MPASPSKSLGRPDQEIQSREFLAEALLSSDGWLTALVRRFGPNMSPEDLRQETYARACAISGEVRPDGATAFLYRIATNILRDEWRGRARRQRPEYRATVDAHEASLAEPDQFQRVLLQDIVRSLSPLQREVFVLSRFRGQSYAEIAAICGISLKAVERRMSEALAHCTEQLRD